VPLVPAKQAIDLGIVVKDLEAMLSFYGGTLGLPPLGEFKVPGGVQHRFLLGDTTMKLVVPDVEPTEASPVGEIKVATGIRYWTAHVAGIDALVTECVAAGAVVNVPISNASTGARYAVLRDPDGNCFELIEPAAS
jgi:catechol 2,3-dioxygenase-like lactoylglutathione lyase family enzyme